MVSLIVRGIACHFRHGDRMVRRQGCPQFQLHPGHGFAGGDRGGRLRDCVLAGAVEPFARSPQQAGIARPRQWYPRVVRICRGVKHNSASKACYSENRWAVLLWVAPPLLQYYLKRGWRRPGRRAGKLMTSPNAHNLPGAAPDSWDLKGVNILLVEEFLASRRRLEEPSQGLGRRGIRTRRNRGRGRPADLRAAARRSPRGPQFAWR